MSLLPEAVSELPNELNLHLSSTYYTLTESESSWRIKRETIYQCSLDYTSWIFVRTIRCRLIYRHSGAIKWRRPIRKIASVNMINWWSYGKIYKTNPQLILWQLNNTHSYHFCTEQFSTKYPKTDVNLRKQMTVVLDTWTQINTCVACTGAASLLQRVNIIYLLTNWIHFTSYSNLITFVQRPRNEFVTFNVEWW